MDDAAPAYLERKRADLSFYRTLLASGDLESIRLLAHKMKGTGTGYGFPALTKLGGAIESAAVAGNRVELAAKIAEMARVLNAREPE